MTNLKTLDAFFKPRSIAVIGASRDERKIGHAVFKALLNGFNGRVFPINSGAPSVLNKIAYPSVLEVKEQIDLAVLAIPAEFVLNAVKQCIKKKIKAAVIITSGFSEIGNTKLERQLAELAKNKIRIIGPNCLGVLDAHSKVDTLFLPPEKLMRPEKGNIAFISQSGAVGSVIIDWIASEGFGVSKFISYGNAVDVNEIDLLEYLG